MGRPRKYPIEGIIPESIRLSTSASSVGITAVSIQEPIKLSASKVKDGWYWFGMLPASEGVEWLVPDDKANSDGSERYRIDTLDAWRMWNRQEHINKSMRIWVGKCRQFSSIGIRGFTFPGYSEYVDPQEGETVRIPFPGNAKRMRSPEAEMLIKNCYRSYIHFPTGVENIMKARSSAEIVDMDRAIKPPDMLNEMWQAQKHLVSQPESFDTYHDKYVADFVYLVHLPNIPWHPEGLDENEYRWKSNKFHQSIVPQLNQEFFKNPPISVAEMYPHEPAG